MSRGVALLAMAALFLPAPRAQLVSSPAVAAACPMTEGGTGLLCADLLATPDLDHVRAVLDIMPVPTPFGVSVTVDGHPRQLLGTSVSGLPDPRSLGNYAVYVAWAYTLALDSAVKLGVVGNGRLERGDDLGDARVADELRVEKARPF